VISSFVHEDRVRGSGGLNSLRSTRPAGPSSGRPRPTLFSQREQSYVALPDYIDGGADSDTLGSADGGGVDTILNVP